MAINLKKGQRIDLVKQGTGGEQLNEFCVGCNWGAITHVTSGFLGFGTKKEQRDVDLDLSCVLTDEEGNMVDHIYSPAYTTESLRRYGMPPGKLDSDDRALHHSGDDQAGDAGGEDDGLDNEVITVNLSMVSPKVSQIFFFLNIFSHDPTEVFSSLPYTSIRMYEGTPTQVRKVFASYDIAELEKCVGKKAMVMGKLYRRDGRWKFAALGDAYDDNNLCLTIRRILKDYAK